MRKYISFAFVFASFAAALFLFDGPRQNAQATAKPAGQVREMPEVILLAKGSKQGTVTFNHKKHNSGEYSLGGPIRCVDCHHTAQPVSELAKLPPLKTVWPTGRTTSLTYDLFTKDPVAAGVAKCSDCHAHAGQKPVLIAEIPVLKDPGSTATTTLTNQLAVHQTCDSCHFRILANRSDSKAPDATVCGSCHIRAAN